MKLTEGTNLGFLNIRARLRKKQFAVIKWWSLKIILKKQTSVIAIIDSSAISSETNGRCFQHVLNHWFMRAQTALNSRGMYNISSVDGSSQTDRRTLKLCIKVYGSVKRNLWNVSEACRVLLRSRKNWTSSVYNSLGSHAMMLHTSSKVGNRNCMREKMTWC